MSTTTTSAAPAAPMAQRVSEWGPVAVSIVVLAIFLAAIVVAWEAKDPSLNILLGMAGANAGTAVGFWLGSSSGSQKKDAVLAAQATPAPGTTTTTVTPAAPVPPAPGAAP